jgi:Putative lumazine-binding
MWVFAVPAIAAVVAAAAVVVISGGDDGGEEAADVTSAPAPELPAPLDGKDAAGGGAAGGGAAGGGAAGGENAERQVVRAAREYLDGIDARDGERVCAVLAPGAIQNLRLPRERAGCETSLDASIGYRDPRGFPVFDRVRVESVEDVTVGAGEARVTITVVTRFADRDQPSIEDDLIYLVEIDGEWRVVKPSATLYRAVGKLEAPPEAIAPPG